MTSLFSKLAGPGFRLCRIPGAGIDLAKTLECGQVFHWTRCEPGFVGTIGETPSYLKQVDGDLLVPEGHGAMVKRYLALDHPIDVIEASFPEDSAIKVAVRFSRGIRIIRQPIWECLATFLTSAMKQVSHIRSISLAVRERFGRAVRLGALELYAFPTPETIAACNLSDLLECRLGFRARNVLATAQMVAAKEIRLEELSCLPTAEARQILRQCPGVGDKIANCVLLFALERMDAVPIDVWISRALQQTYFSEDQNVKGSRLSEFCTYFGPYAGYAQQYLFHYWRMTYRKTR
ncbi:MAG TPA: DNA glycosylase [Chthoniobacterales bacterium]|nr:DNA glycosylase [Chthoniobacterales bacterium]